MYSLFQDLGLSVFSVCLQSSIGIIFFVAIFKFRYKKEFTKPAMIAATLAVIGVLSSFSHLGNPMNAYLTMSNLSSSWLSREIFFTSLYTGLVCVYALILYTGKFTGILTPICALSLLAGIFDLYVMSQAYISTSVPFWDSANTYFEYYLSALMLGAIFFYTLTYKKMSLNFYVFGIVILVLAGMLSLSYVLHGLGLSQGSLAAKQSESILFSYSNLILLISVLGAVSIFLFFVQGIRSTSDKQCYMALNLPLIATIFLFIVAVLAKLIFYVAMVTTTVGLQ
ncbi:dimethyl sulfoxide reductase anchor subunit family protein [Campylobacter concisus]|uniref:dimethyl sulfoxide reductase anchor subunit family protein n=1 Tax=Campylobacter concisus TaxID=199 RepID=UPI000D2FAB57|nr:DmsC/YnfH family molybdoenzyme membrane anchor subunit [Campylobacter concisus]